MFFVYASFQYVSQPLAKSLKSNCLDSGSSSMPSGLEAGQLLFVWGSQADLLFASNQSSGLDVPGLADSSAV